MNTFLRLFSNSLLLYSLVRNSLLCRLLLSIIVIYFRCGFIIEPAIHYHKMRARKWVNRQLLLIINHLSFPYQKQRVGKMGNEWGKNPQKNGDSVPDNFHFPQKTVLFHPEFRISLLLQIHSQPYKRAWLPQKKAQKLEKWNRYSPQKRSFLEDTSLFSSYTEDWWLC